MRPKIQKKKNSSAFLSIKLKVQAKSVHASGNASLGVVRRPLWR
jgi:hypothetical protein